MVIVPPVEKIMMVPFFSGLAISPALFVPSVYPFNHVISQAWLK
jgi:hypothetical protein